MDNEKLSVVALNTIVDLVPKKLISLINYFGNANNVLNADIKELESVCGISDKIAKSIKSLANLDVANKEFVLAEKNSIKILTYLDEDYPSQLKNIYDFPPVLYIKGNFDKNDNLSVSVVGSRRPTNYGLIVTEKFCKYFAQNSITTISGLASGIDTQAHTSAIKNSGYDFGNGGNGKIGYLFVKINNKLEIENYLIFNDKIVNIQIYDFNINVFTSLSLFVFDSDLNKLSSLKFEYYCIFGKQISKYWVSIFNGTELKIYDIVKNKCIDNLKYEFSENIFIIKEYEDYLYLIDNYKIYKCIFYNDIYSNRLFIYDDFKINEIDEYIIGIPRKYKLENISYIYYSYIKEGNNVSALNNAPTDPGKFTASASSFCVIFFDDNSSYGYKCSLRRRLCYR